MSDWFAKHSGELSKRYSGKHIAIVKNKIVSVGNTPVQVFKEAKFKHPKEKISLAYIPTDEETVTLL